jgi:hypothetical protein
MGAMRRVWGALALMVAGAVGCGASGASSATGGTATLSIGDAAGSNVATSIPPISVVLGYVGQQVGVLSYEQQPSVNVKRWQLVVDFTDTPMTGQTFTIAQRQALAGTTAMAAMDMEELPASGSFREWSAVSGSISVPSRVGDQVTLAFTGVPFMPAQGGSGNEAMGTFTLTGRITVDDINQPLPAN